ncbi:MAG: hypothetical protein J3Q66DRAFT_122804 [Benniella sp.]|nr:MAG: hypothetical protein J3Q66DRAFT_122804 [Benniella sp.]
MRDIPGLSPIVTRLKRRHHSQAPATVFDLPELYEIIFSHLSRSDLARWAHVGKTWHHTILPYIWSDMSTLTKSQYKLLSKMLINDYQRVHKTTEESQQSSLTKYGPLIRKLGIIKKPGYPSVLFDFILKNVKSSSDNKESAAMDVFRHFMKHCTHLHSLYFNLMELNLQGTSGVMAETAIQQLSHLSIRSRLHDWTFKYIMSRCSTSLETLEIFALRLSDESDLPAIEIDAEGLEPLANLKRLAITNGGLIHSDQLYSLWRRCGSIESLGLLNCDGDHVIHMTDIIETFFPNLTAITLSHNLGSYFNGMDMLRILSTSRQGWRSVDLRGYLAFNEHSWEELFRHTSTLENVTFGRWDHQEGIELVRVLSSFPKLQTFITHADGWIECNQLISIDAKDWIYQDPLSGSLTPWPCEHILTDLRIKISGIPRPDVTRRPGPRRQPVMAESYTGEGRMIQHQVYKRLSRFVNLEVLCLGSVYCFCEDTSKPVGYVDHQYECLEMSLESGLDQLGGLKRLRILNVSLMAHKVGLQEAQWMAEQWPKLHEVHGLGSGSGSRKARHWFKKNYPGVTTPPIELIQLDTIVLALRDRAW